MVSTVFTRDRDLVLLIGAGASADADIPTAQNMVSEIERKIASDTDRSWNQYEDLYNSIKAAIFYAAGVNGRFSADEVNFNIEVLVNTLYEIERNRNHPLYPFVAAWSHRLVELAGSDFYKVTHLRRAILGELKSWMAPETSEKADYYYGLRRLQSYITFPLQVFSLNYDRCIESLASDNFKIETGFGGFGPDHPWEWRRFESQEGDLDLPQLYLYKLHGSTHWKRSGPEGNLYCVEHTESISPEEMELIFGRDAKMESADPYLFYLYMFRVACLESRLILAIGFGFGDHHINNIIAQALKSDPDRRLMVIGYCLDQDATESWRQKVVTKLEVPRESVVVLQGSAKSFLEDEDIGNRVAGHVVPDDGRPF